MFLHQVCWKHHCNFLWIPFSIFSLFCLFLAFFIGRQYCASQFQGDNPEILSKTKFCFWFGEHQLMWSNCWKTIFDSIAHYYCRKADDNTNPISVVCGKNNCVQEYTKQIKNCEWEMFLFFICPQLVQTGQLLDSQCYSLSLEHPDFHETTRLPLGELLNSPCYKRSQAPP